MRVERKNIIADHNPRISMIFFSKFKSNIGHELGYFNHRGLVACILENDTVALGVMNYKSMQPTPMILIDMYHRICRGRARFFYERLGIAKLDQFRPPQAHGGPNFG